MFERCNSGPVFHCLQKDILSKISLNISPLEDTKTIQKEFKKTLHQQFLKEFLLCENWGSLRHLPRVCGQNH